MMAIDTEYVKDFRGEVNEKFGKLFKILEGNGQVGLIVRVDRNTGFRKGISKLLWLIVGLQVGIIGRLVWVGIGD